MRTRLQMTAAEARASREQMLRDMKDLANYVGAPICDIRTIDSYLKQKYGRFLTAKEGYLPRMEQWSIRFTRMNGGWLTTGEMLKPTRTVRFPGDKIPRYVRLRVPIRKDGIVPASLAPRREDLPRLAPGKWRHVGRPRGTNVPTLTVEVDAPRFGVVIHASSSGLDPVLVRFPANKKKLGAALSALVERYTQVKRVQFGHNAEEEEADGREASAASDHAAA